MLRRLLRKIRARLVPPIDPNLFDPRMDHRFDLRIGEQFGWRFDEHLGSRLEAIEARIEALIESEVNARIEARLEAMMRIATDEGHPNVNRLWGETKDLESMRLDIKLLGYQMGIAHEYRLQAIPVATPGPFLNDWKPVTQGDMETRWFRYWCEQLKERPRYHRKLWEFAYIMQGLLAADALKRGARVLVLGTAHQPAPSYLAAKGVNVIIAQTEGMPGPGGDPLCNDELVDPAVFEKLVVRRIVDFSGLPEDLAGFDACICMGEGGRRGSIKAGMDFIVGTIGLVKPGGVVVQVVDFNYANDDQTLDNWGSVLFQRRHFEAIAQAWKASGHEVTPLDFNTGFEALDRFVDIPPFDVNRTESMERLWRDGWQSAHLKTAVDGFSVTSFGMVARRARNYG